MCVVSSDKVRNFTRKLLFNVDCSKKRAGYLNSCVCSDNRYKYGLVTCNCTLDCALDHANIQIGFTNTTHGVFISPGNDFQREFRSSIGISSAPGQRTLGYFYMLLFYFLRQLTFQDLENYHLDSLNCKMHPIKLHFKHYFYIMSYLIIVPRRLKAVQ